jgi:hypothetical protein
VHKSTGCDNLGEPDEFVQLMEDLLELWDNAKDVDRDDAKEERRKQESENFQLRVMEHQRQMNDAMQANMVNLVTSLIDKFTNASGTK